MISDRELDALVAEHVMGLPEVKKATAWGYGPYECQENMPYFYLRPREDKTRACAIVASYSTDIAAAWEIVECMKNNGWYIAIQSLGADWDAMFYREGVFGRETRSWYKHVPRAICVAALKAVGYKGDL